MGRSKGRFGVCAECKYFDYAVSEWDRVFAVCTEFEGMSMRSGDPITQCTKFYPYSHPELWDMEQMATKITVKRKRKKNVGFGKDDEEDEIIVKSEAP